jgi:hypothetical protein
MIYAIPEHRPGMCRFGMYLHRGAILSSQNCENLIARSQLLFPASTLEPSTTMEEARPRATSTWNAANVLCKPYDGEQGNVHTRNGSFRLSPFTLSSFSLPHANQHPTAQHRHKHVTKKLRRLLPFACGHQNAVREKQKVDGPRGSGGFCALRSGERF